MKSSSVFAWVTSGVVLVLCFGGCNADAGAPGGALEQALSRARAPQAPPPMALAAYGAVRIETRAELRMGDEARVEGAEGGEARPSRLSIERTILRAPLSRGSDSAQGGERFRVIDRRTHIERSLADPKVDRTFEERFEGVFDGQRFAERRGDGPWIERDVLDGLPRRVLARVLDLGGPGGRGFVLTAWGDYLRREPMREDADHPGSLAGVPVTWSRVRRDREIRPRKMTLDEVAELARKDDRLPLWFAATHAPDAASGELALNAAGEVVAGRLELSGVTTIDGRPVPFVFTFSQTVGSLPEGASFELPAERLPISRERPWLMVEDVLGDKVLPPYR